MVLVPIVLCGQATGSFRLFFDDMVASGFANWSYDLGDPGFIHGDGNPYTVDALIPMYYHTFAYNRFGWGEGSDYSCLMEDLPFAAVPGDLHVSDYTDFELVGFNRINTVNPLGVWGTLAESGEARTYVAPYYLLTCNGEWMTLADIQLDAILPYATAETMRANLLAFGPLYAGAENWQNDMGTGHPVTGHGRARISGGSVNFLAAMDNGTHQIEFDIVTFDYLIQGETGSYDMIIDVYPAGLEHNIANPEVDVDAVFPQHFDLPDVDLSLDVIIAVGGGPLAANDTWINQVPELPGGALPAGIAEFAPVYWDISTTLENYNMDIVFDFTDFLPFGDPANWRLCKRDSELAAWVIYPNISVAGNTITAWGVIDLSEWALGNTEPTLPVELSAFTAFVTSDNLVSLEWITQSETNLSGYNILRGNTDDLGTALDLQHFIEASNSSTSHSYSFVEETALEPGTYYYWLQAVELNGEFAYHGPAQVTVSPEGGENPPEVPTPVARLNVFPNPFNPLTRIAVFLPDQHSGQCSIYNSRGELVYQYAPQSFNEGWNYLSWNGTDASGQPCGSGIYLIRVSGGDLSLQSKVVLMK